jgi:hypothetical protein
VVVVVVVAMVVAVVAVVVGRETLKKSFKNTIID